MVAKNYLSILIVLMVLNNLSGCNEHINVEKGVKTNEDAHMTLIDNHSGYTPGTEQWTNFLSCWYSAGRIRHEERQKDDPDLPYLPILDKYAHGQIEAQSAEDITTSIVDLETSLGVSLPRSYKDFLLAYRPSLLKPQMVSGGSVLIGMFAPSQVGRIATLAPELSDFSRKYPIEASDKEYFVYGIKQKDIHVRTRYIPDAIVVGKYGDAMYEMIVLYPQNKTADGEMEAALHFHSGEFRAPSFAELMRQLSILETKAIEHVPPYPKNLLKGTCADKLPLANIWWG